MDITFEEFVAESHKWEMRNAWVMEPGFLHLYFRVSLPRTGTNFDLANMHTPQPGKGSLTAFLDKYEPQYTFYIENVLNPRLVGYFERRGYVAESRGWADVCMKKIPQNSS